MTAYTAIRADYNRSTRTYDVTVSPDASLNMIHGGWAVYDDAAGFLAGIKAGRYIGSWKPAAVAAVVARMETDLGLPLSGYTPPAPVKAEKVAKPAPVAAPVTVESYEPEPVTRYPNRGVKLHTMPSIGDEVRYSTSVYGVKVGTVVELPTPGALVGSRRVRVKWDRMELTEGRSRPDGKRTWVNYRSLSK